MQLRLRQIIKRFDGPLVLDNVSLTLESARALVLVGPSGGGKSTLLRILGGLEHPDSGEVEIDGEQVVYTEDALLRYRRMVGTVFQSFNLFPHLTALQNITLPLEKVHGRSGTEAQATAQQLLERFRLGAFGNKRPAELSGGQRQRIAIARALASKPKLLLFDEPTSALDPEMTSEVLDMILELRNQGQDFILVTHEMGFARRVADYAAFLAEGKLQETGSAQTFFSAPSTALAQSFLNKVLKY